MKQFTKKLSVLFASLAMVMGAGLAKNLTKDVKADALGEGYVKITNTADLKTGDKAVIYNDDLGKGVTGASTKDATASETEADWVQFEVTTSGSGWTLRDPNVDMYIAKPTTNEFKYNSTAGECSVNADGVLTCNGRYLQANGNFYRMYNSINAAYTSFYVYKIDVITVEDASEIIAAIDAIGTVTYTEECKALIDAARAAYEAAPDLQSEVSNYQVLVDAEAKYAELEAEAKEEVDLAAAKAFEAMVDALPEASAIKDLSKKADIDAAVEAYENLTDDQRALVSGNKVAKLEAIKEVLASLAPQLKYTLDTSVDAIATSNAYNTYSGADSNGTNWYVTLGSKQADGLWLGYNANNRDKAVVDTDNDKEVAIATALSESLGEDVTNKPGWFGIIQEDNPMDGIGGITISYAKETADTTPDVVFILVSTDNGATYNILDRHEMTKAEFNDGEDHVHIFSKNYKNALFAIMLDDRDGSSNTRLKAPKFEFYSYPNSEFANQYVKLWYELRNDEGSICESLNNPAKLQILLERYDRLEEEIRAIVDETIDYDGVTTIKQSVEYVRNVLAGMQATEEAYKSTDTIITMRSETNKTISSLALLVLVGVISVSAYYFIEKKKLAK